MQIIRGMRNEFGVPMEPDEFIGGYDIFGDELYPDDLVADTNHGWVSEYNIEHYIFKYSDPVENGQVTFFDGEVGNAEDYDTFEFDGDIYSLDTLAEFVEFIDFNWKRAEDVL